jgi:hypothetical protein
MQYPTYLSENKAGTIVNKSSVRQQVDHIEAPPDSKSPNGTLGEALLRGPRSPSLKLSDDELPENLTLGLSPHIRDLANSGVFDGKLQLNSTTIIPCPVGCCRGRKLRVHKIRTRIYISVYDISTGRLLLRFHPSIVDIDNTEATIVNPTNGEAA